jgi:hypothetical protein
MHLAAGAAMVEPSAKRDFFADLATQVFDIDARHRRQFKRIDWVYRAGWGPSEIVNFEL